MRWRPEIAADVRELADAVTAFDPGDRASAVGCAAWLKEHALDEPPESVTRLYVSDGRVRGFYALANGEAQLTSRHRQSAGLRRRTQPAVLLTQIARGRGEPAGTGQALVLHAIGTARAASEMAAATILALDPYDEATAKMWADRYHFRNSALEGPGRPKGLFRMWLPLATNG